MAEMIWDQKRLRLLALAGVFEKTDRILTGDRALNVHIINGSEVTHKGVGPAAADSPGFSSYPNIWINQDKFDNLHKIGTMIQLLGLNYHELSHIMFTPRQFRTYMPNTLVMPFNILEDQRIESLFTAMYEPAGKYFTEMVIKFFVGDERTWDTAFLFTHGRSFLPLEIRKEFEDRFIGTNADKRRAKKIIEEYKTLTQKDFEHPNGDSATKLIEAFHRLLTKLHAPNSDCVSMPQSGSVDRSKEEAASQVVKEKDQEERDTGEDQSGFWEDEEDEEEEETDNTTGSDEGDEEDGDGVEETNTEDGEGSGDTETEEGDGEGGQGGEPEDGESQGANSSEGSGEEDQDSDAGDPGEVGSTGGSSPDSGTFEYDGDFGDYLEEVIEAVENDENVAQEVKRVSDAMNDLSDVNLLPFGKERFYQRPVDDNASVLRKVTQDFRRIYADVEPGWKYGSDHGKLNVDRAMRGAVDYDEMFDEWDEGREQESGLEVFIALDMSVSMSIQDLIEPASDAMWIIKRACDDVGALVTVVGFHHSAVGLFEKNQLAPASYIPQWNDLGGSTRPLTAIKMAASMLHYSKMPNKLFVIITDGGWGMEVGSHERALANVEGTKLYIGLGNYYGNESAQRMCDVAMQINDAHDLVPVIKSTIEHIIKSSK